MHLGHYHGALKNWARLQNESRASSSPPTGTRSPRTTRIPEIIEQTVWEMFVDWLACGIDPDQGDALHPVARCRSTRSSRCCSPFFVPLAWLERVPTYKDLVRKHAEQGATCLTYGFLGYPLDAGGRHPHLSRDRGAVGEDQVSHIELTREVRAPLQPPLRREKGFEEKARARSRRWAQEGRSSIARCARVSRSRATRAALEESARRSVNDGAEPLAGRQGARLRLPRGRRAHDPSEPGGEAHANA
jgi:tryptophanyl-tRNA synthetase